VAAEVVFGRVIEIRRRDARLLLNTPAWRRRNQRATRWMQAQHHRMRFWQSLGLPASVMKWLGRAENLAAYAFLSLLDILYKREMGSDG
jgi:hypothetical protein